ncbi:MAG TPA: NADP-dependent oxidoreductase [Capillimicrobium sp.]|nr:NADP-dependent oxidoreductase [Capillimicrobium sp.]
MTIAPTTAATMRAVTVSAFGDPGVLRAVELPAPEPGVTEVLVRVHAAGINPVDYWSRRTGGFGQLGEPAILGHDVSGVVEAVGPGVTVLAPGDEVFGMPRFPDQAGAYGELVVAPARHLARKPAALSHVEAAALPLAGLTAWQALVETAGVEPGTRVLVHGAGGGVGHLAVQIAKARGAEVVGIASAGKHGLLRDLGADELVDYRDADVASVIRDVDVVLDGVGGDTAERSLRSVRDGATILTLPGPPSLSEAAAREAADRGVRIDWPVVEPDRGGLLELARLVDDGRLRPVVDRVFSLEDAAAAHAHGEAGHVTGKLVLEVAGD